MIHFVGAGPGAPDLITLRGADLLRAADQVIYAGSLVNPALLDLCGPQCEIHDSAHMTLEEVVACMQACEARGGMTVRLHTGDTSLYSSIREQMRLLDDAGISYDVVPGVSAFGGAAAALQTEYTLPSISQSAIITRMEGRTPVPDGEKLRLMARHGCTLVLFLSTGLLESVHDELVAGAYTDDTPAAIVYKATWPDERVFRCTVGTLAETAAENGIKNTALIVVGDVLGTSFDRSRLYDPTFSHMFREASQPEKTQDTPADDMDGGASAHQTLALAAFTKQGCELGKRIASALSDDGWDVRVFAPERLAKQAECASYGNLSAWTGHHWQDTAIVFVGASGIAVRSVAPYVQDKFSDPAVVSVDERGTFAVPLLSGHAGGANQLARRIASIVGGRAAVSTATDVNGLFAVDEWACQQGLCIVERDAAKAVSAALLEGEPVGFSSDVPCEGDLPTGVTAAGAGDAKPSVGFAITHDVNTNPFETTLHLMPRDVVVGIGCRRGISAGAVEQAVCQALDGADIDMRRVAGLATIDLKADEQGLLEVARAHGWPLQTFSAQELEKVPGAFSDSEFVKETTGVGNVCERAAVAAGGALLTSKQVQDGVTVALAVRPVVPSFTRKGAGKLSVVGIGPGAGQDMTGRARAAIAASDIIVGYTVYADLLAEEFPDKPVFTTPMRKEVERCERALELARQGKNVAMVCSGDAGVYGMAGLCFELAEKAGEAVDVDVVPGITAATGGAAVLGAPLMHDFAVISLSDLMTSWETIEARLRAAASSDMVVCLYNPSSHKRPDYLQRACDVLLAAGASPETVCGYVRNIGRDGEVACTCTLSELRETAVDMFTTVFVGNSQTKRIGGAMVTPRGYLQRGDE
ncbi:precorrin-4 C(11)-methyltransferase [Slackia heliotrinireducens]|uniref:precorrin-4 C(11)-methyltransferase n=1 Tax=Slackia heliotrinireducens TaxID=84110 RepID=UPI003314F7DE